MTDTTITPETRGVVRGIENEDYHAGPGVSSSQLKVMLKTPAHFYGEYLDEEKPERGPRGGQLEGTLAHTAILEPDEFWERYVVVPEDAPRKPSVTQRNAKNPSEATVEAVEWWDIWEAANEGRIIITQKQAKTALKQADQVRKVEQIGATLEQGEPELSVFWEDPETGILCKCRPDWTHYAAHGRGVVIADVKTCPSAQPEAFARFCAQKKWHVSAAMYADGFRIATGLEVLAFVFIAVESEYPHVATAIMLDEESMDKGKEAYRVALDRYDECLKTGLWPAYSEAIEIVRLPNWTLSEV